jgi:hypothetical protein
MPRQRGEDAGYGPIEVPCAALAENEPSERNDGEEISGPWFWLPVLELIDHVSVARYHYFKNVNGHRLHHEANLSSPHPRNL